MPDFQKMVRAKLVNCRLEPTREAEIIDEISQHLRDQYDMHLSNGATEEEAERIIATEFGERDLAQELRDAYRPRIEPIAPGGHSRDFWGGVWQDLQYSARVLRMNPAFTFVCVASLALGIGANTAIFQLINAVRIRTLPVKNPHELVLIRPMPSSRTGRATGRYSYVTNPMWQEIHTRQQGFSATAAFGTRQFNLERGGTARYAEGLWVSGEFFDMLGVQPVIGRVFHANDDRPSCGVPGAVLSYRFWRHEFNGSPDVLNKTIALDGHVVPVIGVTPAAFHGVDVGHDFDVAVPICSEPAILDEASLYTWRHGWWLAAIGRLKPGWSREKATAQLEAISPEIMRDTLPPKFQGEQVTRYLSYKLQAFPGATGYSNVRNQYESPLWLLLAIAGFVLLIACANLANLMLARASVRSREIAVRMALGANRARLIQQIVTESLVIAAFGAAAGIALAEALSRYLVWYLNRSGDTSTIFLEVATDWRVLGFTMALAIITCLLFGLMPAFQATAHGPTRMISLAGRAMTTRERFGTRRVLVVAQVALSLVLVLSAFLFTRSLRKILSVDAGFQRDGVLTIATDFSSVNVAKGQREVYAQSLLDKVRAVPGVQSAAETFVVPLSGTGWNDRVIVDGRHLDINVDMNLVSDGYFSTMGTPLLAGRDFNERDTANAQLVAIVNEEFARKVLGTQNPIGKTYRIDVYKGDAQHEYEIVGLVKNTKYYDLRDDDGPIAYYPALQGARDMTNTNVLLRSKIDVQDLLPTLRNAIGEVNPAISVDFSLLDQQVKDSLLRERLLAVLSAFFGVLALLLATVGLYGLIAYMATRRTNEIGIRMALGAAPGQILAMMMSEAGRLVLTGVIAGMVLAIAAGRSAASLLFGLRPYDPATMAIAAATLIAIAVAATLLPARRAAKLDPMIALREE